MAFDETADRARMHKEHVRRRYRDRVHTLSGEDREVKYAEQFLDWYSALPEARRDFFDALVDKAHEPALYDPSSRYAKFGSPRAVLTREFPDAPGGAWDRAVDAAYERGAAAVVDTLLLGAGAARSMVRPAGNAVERVLLKFAKGGVR